MLTGERMQVCLQTWADIVREGMMDSQDKITYPHDFLHALIYSSRRAGKSRFAEYLASQAVAQGKTVFKAQLTPRGHLVYEPISPERLYVGWDVAEENKAAMPAIHEYEIDKPDCWL